MECSGWFSSTVRRASIFFVYLGLVTRRYYDIGITLKFHMDKLPSVQQVHTVSSVVGQIPVISPG